MRTLLVPALLALGLSCADAPDPLGKDQGAAKPEPPKVPAPVIHAPPEPLSTERYLAPVDAPSDALDISIDDGGGVWVTTSSGISMRPSGSKFFVTMDSSVPPRAVGGLGADLAAVSWEAGLPSLLRPADGALAASTFGAIDPASPRIRRFDRPEGSRTLVASGANVIELATDGSTVASRALPAPVEASDLALSPSGALWVGSRVGVFRLAAGRGGELGRTFLPLVDLVADRDDDVVALDACDDGTVWVSSLGWGVFRLGDDGRILEHLSTENVLPQDHVLSLACDPDGSVWMGTSWGGLVRRMSDRSVRYHTKNSGLLGDSIRRLFVEVHADGTRTLWIATESGLASHGP